MVVIGMYSIVRTPSYSTVRVLIKAAGLSRTCIKKMRAEDAKAPRASFSYGKIEYVM